MSSLLLNQLSFLCGFKPVSLIRKKKIAFILEFFINEIEDLFQS